MAKKYEVIAPGMVLDGKITAVGDIISLDPKSGAAKSGLHFKQLKPSVAAKKQATQPAAKKQAADKKQAAPAQPEAPTQG
jgi:hypothetical protein